MKSEEEIRNDIENTLNALDGLHRAPGNPWLFARIQEKLRAADTQGFRLAPSVQWALLAVVVLANSLFYTTVLSRPAKPSNGLSATLSQQIGMSGQVDSPYPLR